MDLTKDIAKLNQFEEQCSAKLPKEIDTILKGAEGEKVCAIGFITTDDFYGCYLAWDYSSDIEEYYEWENSLEPSFLYQPLVDVVESCEEIDFCTSSEEKWGFALAFLTVLEKSIRQIPDEIFHKHNFRREDILFFATMGDGDYIQEMMDTSVKMFNAPETLEAYGIV